MYGIIKAMRRLLALTFLFTGVSLLAQSEPAPSFALIVSDGSSAEIVNDRRSRTWRSGPDGGERVILDGARVTNSGETLLQIQLFPGGQQVLLSQNSTVVLEDAGAGAISLSYGRILVSNGFAGTAINVETLIGVARTDTGPLAAEQFVSSATGVAIESFALFEGTGAVEFTEGGSVVLSAGELVEAAGRQPRPIPQEIRNFWGSRNMSEAIALTSVTDRLPGVEGRLISLFGAVPEYLVEKVVEAELAPDPVPEVEETEPIADAPAQPATEAEPQNTETLPASRGATLSPPVVEDGPDNKLFAGVGVSFVGAGLITSAVGFGYSWFGGAFAGGTQLDREQTTTLLMQTGTGLILGGILFYGLSLVK